jgi:hypothetical protein
MRLTLGKAAGLSYEPSRQRLRPSCRADSARMPYRRAGDVGAMIGAWIPKWREASNMSGHGAHPEVQVFRYSIFRFRGIEVRESRNDLGEGF